MPRHIKIPSQKLLELAVLEFGGVITNAYFVVNEGTFNHVFHNNEDNCRHCFEAEISHSTDKGLRLSYLYIVLTFDSTEVLFTCSDFGYIRRAKNLDIQEQYANAS